MTRYHRARRNHLSKVVLFCAASLAGPAVAGEKPPVVPDQPSSLTITSRVSATVEFGLPAIASAIERDIPRRLATIDERIGCVNRRVLVFRIRANCDVDGFVDRGALSLYGRGDRIVGSVPIFGSIEGQGANRFTSRIHGDAEGRAMVEVESRPRLSKDWSIDLNFSDSYHWSEPPILHVLGRDIALTKYAEPSIRKQLGRIRQHAQEATRRLDLHDKAAKAWEQAFQPIQISQDPPVWLQIIPASAAFAGIHANAKDLSGSLELTGTAQTLVGQAPSAVTPTPLPPLGNDISQPGTFDILLPVRVNYDALRDKIMQVVAASNAGPNRQGNADLSVVRQARDRRSGRQARRYRCIRRRMGLFVRHAERRSQSAIDPDFQSGGRTVRCPTDPRRRNCRSRFSTS